ncbi:Cytochrome P450 9e2 [Orchesella cincta]|uniref:Cytochrome P450 9e2 n=1 Tax=Orchesella cincta TaxID=48709 RepID=A0A1D2MF08_ORCCI|nr:Cytochrome P450 9e2 [Orchesella cincta]
MWAEIFLIILLGVVAYKFLFTKSNSIFKEHGIPEIDTSSAVGKLDIFLGRKGMPEADTYAYKLLGTGKYCGMVGMGNSPILIKDTEVMKKILIKDFDHFVDRREVFSEAEVSLKKMLPSLQGDEWKGVRAQVSQTFTSGKIKRMMDCFNTVAKTWLGSLLEKAKRSPDGSASIDALKSVNQYTVDVIAEAVFGIRAGTIKNPNSPFATMAARLSDLTKFQMLKFAISVQLPKLTKLFRLKLIDVEALGVFEQILNEGLKARLNGSTTKRNDFLQLLVEAKRGELKAEGKDELSTFEKEAQITGNQAGGKKQWLTEQIMIHQDVQDKLRNEVRKIIKPDGTLDYDDLSSLVYMDMVICVLRKYPAAARLERKCVRDYKDSETGLVVKKGTIVVVPVYAIHHDKQYYDNPDRFDPEHFAPDKKRPRNCIGMRFARIEVQTAIAHLVHTFRIEPTKNTPVPISGHWAGFGYLPPKGLELKLTPLK